MERKIVHSLAFPSPLKDTTVYSGLFFLCHFRRDLPHQDSSGRVKKGGGRVEFCRSFELVQLEPWAGLLSKLVAFFSNFL